MARTRPDGPTTAAADGSGPDGGPTDGPDQAQSPDRPDGARRRPPTDGAGNGPRQPAPAGRPGARPAPPTGPGRCGSRPRGEGGHAGRRSPAYARRGRVVGSRAPRGKLAGAPHLPATLRAALHRPDGHGGPSAGAAGPSPPRDLREAVHVGREANLVLFVVDASGSMAARQRMTVVKTAVLSLLRDAYQRRDRVGMITFRGAGAEQVLPPTSSHEVGVLRLASLRTGGRTPLAAGSAHGGRDHRHRAPPRSPPPPLLIVVTDGRATSGPDPVTVAPALAGVATVVVDCESGPVRLGLARRLAAALDADVMPLDQLDARRPPDAARRLAQPGGPPDAAGQSRRPCPTTG